MQQCRPDPLWLFALALLPAPAAALVGGSTTSDATWDGVGGFSGTGTCCTGALIGPTTVLTAAHVVNASSVGSDWTFNFSYAGTSYQIPIAPGGVRIHPDYGKGAANEAFLAGRHDDLAVVTLASAVPAGVPIYPLFTGDLPLGDAARITLVSRPGGANRPIGQNTADRLYPADQEPGQPEEARNEVFTYDYDGGGKDLYGPPGSPAGDGLGAGVEAIVSGGDSGAPVFIQDAGVWKIAGVSTFTACSTVLNPSCGQPNTSPEFGYAGGATYLPAYAQWIQAQAVPEPQTWAMLLAGLGLAGLAGRWRGRGAGQGKVCASPLRPRSAKSR